jgi:hypothetical protein
MFMVVAVGKKRETVIYLKMEDIYLMEDGGSRCHAITPYKKCIINMHSVHTTLRFHPRLN